MKNISNKIDLLLKIGRNDPRIINIEARNKLFPNIKFLRILNILITKKYLFHSSNKIFKTLIPQQAKGIRPHNCLNAIYATNQPEIALFYSCVSKDKLNENSFYTAKYLKNENYVKLFATKDILDNLNTGYIYILPQKSFKYHEGEFIGSKNISPILIFATNPTDIVEKIELMPFIETKYDPNQHFTAIERELIRQYIYKHYKLKSPKHGYDHIYRVSEIAFNFALNECANHTNDIFLAACMHDISRENDNNDYYHGQKALPIAKKLLSQFWPSANINLILEAIKYHTDLKNTHNKIIGCLLDADRLDLFRFYEKPKFNYLSTNSGKNFLKSILSQYDYKYIFISWPQIFRNFLDQNKLDDF